MCEEYDIYRQCYCDVSMQPKLRILTWPGQEGRQGAFADMMLKRWFPYQIYSY